MSRLARFITTVAWMLALLVLMFTACKLMFGEDAKPPMTLTASSKVGKVPLTITYHAHVDNPLTKTFSNLCQQWWWGDGSASSDCEFGANSIDYYETHVYHKAGTFTAHFVLGNFRYAAATTIKATGEEHH